jgi:uncharacterized hydrophobic protein (TIGR00271 family)
MKKSNFIAKLFHYFNLESEVDDFNVIHKTIEKDIVFKGTNLWILIFAILVASIGLNMNSTAVIIGAMLISPLMGPIIGTGYSIATYDFPLFKIAIKNFTFAVVASLITSTLYFSISPISTAHSELLARTSPTIYDVLIALVGGLAGIVAISSKQKGNVIPGVAIATALMPPLCTAGFGLATGQLVYFFEALYLFTINTVFIAFSAIVISQILKFPIRTPIEEIKKRKINRYITTLIILIIIPSIYFGYKLVEKEKFSENANKYIRNISVVEGNYLLKNEITPAKKSITLVYGGSNLSEAQKNSIKDKTKDFSLDDAVIIFKQGFSFDDLDKRNTQSENQKSEINRLSMMLMNKDHYLDSLNKRNYRGKQILNEIKKIYPQIETCSYGDANVFRDAISTSDSLIIIVFSTKSNYHLYNSEKKKIQNWLKIRLESEKIKVYYDN